MGLFKTTPEIPDIQLEEPDSIDFLNKTFHLSGNFSIPKKDFGKKLEEVGAKFTGTKETHKHLSVTEADYLVLADNGIKNKGEWKKYGDKTKRVQEYNSRPNQARHIFIITESHCQKLLDELALRKTPKP